MQQTGDGFGHLFDRHAVWHTDDELIDAHRLRAPGLERGERAVRGTAVVRGPGGRTHLHPAVHAGRFNPEFLEVPPECLVLSMQQHQRYVPLRGADGAVLREGPTRA